MSEIRNVLLVTVDCLRADRFRQGLESGLCPTFADLDDRGTSFESTCTVANTTDPSLTSFMTGQYPLDHGVVENGWGLAETEPVAAERFRAAGLDTFGVVSVDHLAHEHSRLGRGFDRYVDGGSRYDALYPILSRIYDTKAFNAAFGAVKNVGIGRYTVKNLLRDVGLIDLHCRPARSVTADTVEQLEETATPFFGWVHYFDVHEPRNAPGEFLGDHDEYTAAMMHVDRHVGELLHTLEDRGLREETLVVLTGDHGEALEDHGYTGHGRTLYDEELRVPLVFAHESLPRGTVDAQVRTIDVLPTLLDLLGADGLEAAGAPLFEGGPTRDDRPVYAMAYPTFGDRVSLRTPDWKLIRDREAGTEELYHLTADPGERRDLLSEGPDARNETDRHSEAPDARDTVDSERPDVRERQASLATDLDAWLSSFGETDRQEVDAETEAMLADLGYRE
jgi:arylsulfatase A-like enzyme